MTPSRRRALSLTVLVLGLGAFGLTGLRSSWETGHRRVPAGDFATYYYAFEAAASGGDPYDTDELRRLAREDGVRRGVPGSCSSGCLGRWP